MKNVILACLLAPAISLAGTGVPQTPEEVDEMAKKIVDESLRDIEEFLQNLTQSRDPIQCVADGEIIECRDVEGEIVPIPDGIKM